MLDLVLTAKVERPAKPTREADGEGVSVSYQLDGRTSLPSRSDRQLIQIASLPMKGDFYRVAIPVLTSAVGDETVLELATAISPEFGLDLRRWSIRRPWRHADRLDR